MGFKVVVSKELKRVFSDKKMIFSIFILPIFMVIGIFALIFMLITNIQKDIEAHKSIVYIQSAPESFVTMMNEDDKCDIKYVDASYDVSGVKDGILDGEVDLLVVFPDNFEEVFSSGDVNELLEIKTFYNPSEDNSSEARARFVDGYFESYRYMLMTDRFENPAYAMVFAVDTTNTDMVIQDNENATGKMIGMFVPYFITILLFAGAMGLGVDTIAGEKERGTMASLLLTPVKRTQIVMGKIVGLGILSICSAAIYIICMVIFLPLLLKNAGLSDALSNFSLTFTPVQITQIVVLLIGIVWLYVALIVMVSVLSKNSKEAQSFIMPLYMIVMVVGMINMYTTDSSSIVGYMIPLYNTSVAFKGIFSMEMTMPEYLTAVIITYGFAILLVAAITRAFKSEKVMLNA